MNFQMNRWFGWVGEPDMLGRCGWQLFDVERVTPVGAVARRVSRDARRSLGNHGLNVRLPTTFARTFWMPVYANPCAAARTCRDSELPGYSTWMLARVARRSPVVQRGLSEGRHVTGTTSAFGFFQAIRQFETADVSASIRQNVLLLAGGEDHHIPVEQWHDQMGTLKNTRSITARLFSRSERAHNHCQVGNYGLALRTIVNWLDEMIHRTAAS